MSRPITVDSLRKFVEGFTSVCRRRCPGSDGGYELYRREGWR